MISDFSEMDLATLSEKELLGFKIFTDTRLSLPQGQSCASCHSPRSSFADPSLGLFPVSQGALSTHFGNRNAPSPMYGQFIPPLHQEVDDQGRLIYVGGLFLDGRAHSLEDQAKGPLLNPIEMGSTKLHVVTQACSIDVYGTLFRKVFGHRACPDGDLTEAQVVENYDYIANAVASFESTKLFSPFSSKFDRVMARQDTFTGWEEVGFNVFKDEKRGNCAACHSLDTKNSAKQPLFTDFTYDNLGLPKNPEVTQLGHIDIDMGLFATTHIPQNRGFFRVPTLRNIALTAPYGHNGYFKTLEQVIDFYNTRDTKPPCQGDLPAKEAVAQNCWPRAEVSETVNHKELGNLKLTQQDQKALVEFLKTLTDE